METYRICVRIDDVWETLLCDFYTKEECDARISVFREEFPTLDFSIVHNDSVDDTYWDYLFSCQGLEID